MPDEPQFTVSDARRGCGLGAPQHGLRRPANHHQAAQQPDVVLARDPQRQHRDVGGPDDRQDLHFAARPSPRASGRTWPACTTARSCSCSSTASSSVRCSGRDAAGRVRAAAHRRHDADAVPGRNHRRGFVSTQPITQGSADRALLHRPPVDLLGEPAGQRARAAPTPRRTSTSSVTDNDVGACQPRSTTSSSNFFEPGITPTSSFRQARSSRRRPDRRSPSASTSAERRTPIRARTSAVSSTRSARTSSSAAARSSVQPAGSRPAASSRSRKELMITSTSVVDDPNRTTGDGAWSFGHLMRQLAPSADQAPAFALALFQHWLTDQSVNGFTVAARPGDAAADPGHLAQDADRRAGSGPGAVPVASHRQPVRPAQSRQRQSRARGASSFALTPPGSSFGEEFTVILEYNLPAATAQDGDRLGEPVARAGVAPVPVRGLQRRRWRRSPAVHGARTRPRPG